MTASTESAASPAAAPHVRGRPMAPPATGRTAAAVVGAAGYVGAELVHILASHPNVTLAGLFGSTRAAAGARARLGDLFPRFRGVTDLPVEAIDLEALGALGPDVVFLATPHEASHDLVPPLLARGVAVIDLSGAFRLRDASLYPEHYGFTHQAPDALAAAVYGIPELHRAAMPGARLIAVAGCYPTSVILPLRPLAAAGAIERGWQVIVDSTSGVSGAGRASTPRTHFCEVSLQPYGVFTHRHAPEMVAHGGAPVIFTPHLGAFDRGILSTMHVRLAAGWTAARVAQALQNAYGQEPFVRLLPGGEWPSVGAVRHTNFCDIGWAVDDAASHLILVSAIDNLVKGAAGQAVQCFNAQRGLPETTGLTWSGA